GLHLARLGQNLASRAGGGPAAALGPAGARPGVSANRLRRVPPPHLRPARAACPSTDCLRGAGPRRLAGPTRPRHPGSRRGARQPAVSAGVLAAVAGLKLLPGGVPWTVGLAAAAVSAALPRPARRRAVRTGRVLAGQLVLGAAATVALLAWRRGPGGRVE